MKDIDDILTEIFSASPLPNRLKAPKQRFLAGKLGINSKISIVQKYSRYEVRVVCVAKVPG